jgi:hypothetical protein
MTLIRTLEDKQGHNYIMEKVEMSKIELELPITVLDFVYKFQIIC